MTTPFRIPNDPTIGRIDTTTLSATEVRPATNEEEKNELSSSLSKEIQYDHHYDAENSIGNTSRPSIDPPGYSSTRTKILSLIKRGKEGGTAGVNEIVTEDEENKILTPLKKFNLQPVQTTNDKDDISLLSGSNNDPPEQTSSDLKHTFQPKRSSVMVEKLEDRNNTNNLPMIEDSGEIDIPVVPFLPQNNDDKHDEDEDEGLCLEEDTYTLLLVTTNYGVAFWLALFICSMQVGLLSSILEQMLSTTGPDSTGTTLNIPFATTTSVKFGQFIAILFGLLTQRDLLETIPLIIALRKTENWSQLNRAADGKGVLRSNPRIFWWEKIFVTYFLRLSVSLLGIFTAFILIIQSTNIIDLVKDFTALYIVSELDEYAFSVIKDGYFGHVFKKETNRMKETKIKDGEFVVSCCNKPVPIQSIVILVLFNVMFGTWMNFLLKQNNGRFFNEIHKKCNVIENDKSLSYLSWGDGECDPKLFTEECGLDGGDCNDQCTTYFQFNVPDPYFSYDIVNEKKYNNIGTYLGYYATLNQIEIFPLADILLEQFHIEYEACEIVYFEDILNCNDIKPECINAIYYDEETLDLTECFSEETLYDNNSSNLWYCFFGADSIILPTKGNAKKELTRSQHLGHQ